ncbi:MAG: glycine oxidase ThiO [Acidobacteria bacterium]|nr:glycine oxidase ThiO [Acidobacteriota bacterium]
MGSAPAVLVIGGGVIGATAAWELASAGARVRLFDARRPGDGATRASAGVLAPYLEGHAASPLRELGRESLDLYDAFVARLSADSDRAIVYRRDGSLEVALTMAEAERLSAASAVLWRDGVEARWVPGAVIPDIEPNAAPDAPGALLIPMHGHVGVTSLTAAAVAGLRQHGGEVVEASGAIEVSRVPGGGVRVRSDAATWEADLAVLAAGSWSSRITVEAADPVPVRPIRGQLLQLAAAPGTVSHIVWGTAGYLVPWPDGSVLVGATVEDVGFDESATDEARLELLEMAAALVPALKHATLADVRVGLRPRGPDDLPIVGRSAAVPGLVYATAHYRSGVLLAPLTAQLVRRLVFDPSAATIPALDPARCGTL